MPNRFLLRGATGTIVLLISSGVVVALMRSHPLSVVPVPPPKSAVSEIAQAINIATGFPAPSPTWLKQVLHARVWDARGHLVRVPTNRPIFLFAWWCPHCHAALRELKRLGDLNRFTFVSLWINAGLAHPGAIRTERQAAAITERELKTIGVYLPADRLYFARPASKLSTRIHGVPTILVPTPRGWMIDNGAPTSVSGWITLLKS